MNLSFTRDLGASVVVFLVALPLCLGIAIASGVPPALGIVSGVIGGIVVGALAGSPLQVTGPAAGLVVSVWTVIEGWGIEALGLAVLISGSLQLLAAAFKLGRWFRAVSPALVGGMLAGIGVLITASQLHVMVEAAPPSGGIEALVALPGAWSVQLGTTAGLWSGILGVLTIATLVLWNRYRPARLKTVPGPLIAVLGVTVVSAVAALPVARVALPDSLATSLTFIDLETSASLIGDVGFLGAALALGLIAAAETLLCANATDLLHDGPRTRYDKELFALGVGNVTAGLVGALPMTGVIVRSSANIEAGAKTRASAIFHGFMLLALVAFAPWLLGYIPVAALAGMLVYVGAKLLNPQKIMALKREGLGELAVFVVTVVAIVFTGLLWGILIGLGFAILRLVYAFSHIEVEVTHGGDRWDVDVHGAATFIQLPRLAEALEAIPDDAEVHVHLGGLAYVDHACAELLKRQQDRHERAGGMLVTEWDEVRRLRDEKPLLERVAERPIISRVVETVERASVKPAPQAD